MSDLDLDKAATRARLQATLFGDAPTVKVGPYTVLSRLGRGGMGVVWSAFDERLNRRVAIKLLPPAATADAEARALLLREARTLAQLQHPNVVAVHDVGEHDGHVFLAMELVTGKNLRQWLVTKRSEAQVLDVLRQAALGISAAHRAGLVHRDIKPENVLVGDDGRVRVADFGLARRDRASAAQVISAPIVGDLATADRATAGATTAGAATAGAATAGAATAGAAATADAPAAPASSAPLDETITTTAHGGLGGTPAYMAPELLLGRAQAADERGDQWSFAVMAFEALSGGEQRPFRAESVDKLLALYDAASPATTLPRASAEQQRALSRALSFDARARYGSVDELAAALLPPTARARGRALTYAGAAGAIAVVAAAIIIVASPRSEDCAATSDLLAPAWDEPARARLSQSLAGNKLSKEFVGAVVAAVDSYRDGLRTAAAATCDLKNRRGIDDAEGDRRRACLERGRLAATSLLDKLATADEAAAAKATRALAVLPDPAVCNDPLALASSVPVDPAARAAVLAVQRQIQEADQLRVLGRPKDALASAQAAVKSADESAALPARAQAMVALAEVRTMLGENANEDFLSAVQLGLRSGADEAAVVGMQALAFHAAEKDAQPATAALLADVGRALADRLPPAVRARRLVDLSNVDCTIALRTNQWARAEAACSETLRLREGVLGKNHPQTAAAALNVGIAYAFARDAKRAAPAFADAVERLRASYGARHPIAMQARVYYGAQLTQSGAYDDAERAIRPALADLVSVYGEKHPEVVTAHMELATLAIAKRDGKAALEAALKSEALRKEMQGEGSDYHADGLSHVGVAYRLLGDEAKAHAAFLLAYRIQIAATNAEDPATFVAQVNYGTQLLRDGALDEARPILERVVRLVGDSKDVDVATALEAKLRLAELIERTNDVGRREQARAWASEAHELFAKLPAENQLAEDAAALVARLAK